MKRILFLILSLFFAFNSFGQSTFINEISYLPPNLCLEIVTPKGTDLSNWELNWYDASGSSSGSQGLGGTINSSAGGYDIIIVDVIIFMNSSGGVSLTDDNGNVVQFLSFGTQITAVNGPAVGLTSTDIGTQTDPANSLQLTGEGDDVSDFTWTNDQPSSCGLTNVEQVISIIGGVTLLPVDLLYFKANKQDGKVYLEWATLNELNNSHFLVEKSKDGSNWSTLGEIPGKLNSNQKVTYEYFDHDPVIGINYYRLSQFDMDGKLEVFEIVALQMKAHDDIQLFPNPTSKVLRIKLPDTDNIDNAKISIQNVFGKQVTIDQRSLEVIDVSSLEAGTYLIQITIGDQHYQKLFTKI